ncbi:SDR family NAD(P)-dependent oxidoreductase [Haloferula chungangensis]|uniref:SDR family NAD(P)-dependent oxidoreductase n=1 Tax=Haloferula chungangensis TaxID=1048331 RepID=A0ABW2L3N4_9BACT
MSAQDIRRCAVVTGASSGLGEEFARQLAPACRTLVLIARRGERLEKLARILRAEHAGLEVGVLSADLTDPSAREAVIAKIAAAKLQPDLLVNNAGMGDYGEFSEAEWPKLESMLKLNIEALTHLAHALVPLMKAGGGGSIINVSSLASLLPIPDFAVYAATKAYVTSFSEALRIEVAPHGISVTALCPGPVHTEFGEVAMKEGSGNKFPGREFFYVEAEQVVREALLGASANRARVFPGWQVAAAAVVISALPIVLIRLAMGTRPRR